MASQAYSGRSPECARGRLFLAYKQLCKHVHSFVTQLPCLCGKGVVWAHMGRDNGRHSRCGHTGRGSGTCRAASMLRGKGVAWAHVGRDNGRHSRRGSVHACMTRICVTHMYECNLSRAETRGLLRWGVGTCPIQDTNPLLAAASEGPHARHHTVQWRTLLVSWVVSDRWIRPDHIAQAPASQAIIVQELVRRKGPK
eukprot:1150828-Pelagomonas_calceolata.AAC.1